MNRGEWEGKKEEEGVKTKVALVQKQKELKKIESSPLTRLPLPPPPLLLPLWFLSDPPLRFEGHCSARKAKKAATVVVLAVVVVVATADKTAQGRRKAISRTLTCHHVNSGPERKRKSIWASARYCCCCFPLSKVPQLTVALAEEWKKGVGGIEVKTHTGAGTAIPHRRTPKI